jgi:glycosyltransferase involved in cell wall biosynthesis
VVQILVVTNSLSGGGAEKAMNLLVNALVDQGKNVVLLTINKSKPDGVSVKSQVESINRTHDSGIFETFLSWARFQIMLIKLRPKIVLLNCDLPEFFGAVAITRAKLVCIEHSDKPWNSRRNLGRFIRYILRIKRVTWVAVSEYIKIWPWNKEPSCVINNLLWFSIGNIGNFSGPINRLIFIGRISPEKNPDAFLEIVNLSNISALMIGEGEKKLEIQKLARSLNLNICFKGFVSNPWELLRKGDVLIVPSVYEGDGLVVAEAIQRQIPLIISDIVVFRRFQLAEFNYAKNISDFIGLIESNKYRSEDLKPNQASVNYILKARNTELLTKRWVSLIEAELGKK